MTSLLFYGGVILKWGIGEFWNSMIYGILELGLGLR